MSRARVGSSPPARARLRLAARAACALALAACGTAALGEPPAAQPPAPEPEREVALPDCRGKERLEGRVEFEWPQLAHRLKELSAARWSSFACAAPAAEVADSFRAQLAAPPYDLTETNWLAIREGTLAVYHSASARAWLYVWIVPRPGDPQRAYVVVARSTGRARRCERARLAPPALARSAPAARDARC